MMICSVLMVKMKACVQPSPSHTGRNGNDVVSPLLTVVVERWERMHTGFKCDGNDDDHDNVDAIRC